MRISERVRRHARPGRVLAMAVALSAVVLATSCVLDISNDLGGATFIALNDRGTFLASKGLDVVTIPQGGQPTALARPTWTQGMSGSFINNDGVVAGVGQAYNQSFTVLQTFPIVWGLGSEPIDFRKHLANGADPRFNASPVALTSTRLLGRQYFQQTPPAIPEWRFFVWDLGSKQTTYLSPLVPGGWFSDINERGVIVGRDAPGHGFRLMPQADGTYTSAGLEPIPVVAADINNRGDILGVTSLGATDFAVLPENATQPVTLAPHGLPIDETLPEFGPRGRINDEGMVVITRKRVTGSPTGTPVRYASASAPAEPFPGLDNATGAEILGLNNKNRAIGYVRGTDGVERPFSWTP